jgi:type IV pilus assembly protein PilY1
MRGSNNGNDGSNAAKGGLVGQEVGVLNDQQMTDFRKWLCPYGESGCYTVRPNGSGPSMQMFATANDQRFSKQGSARAPITEMLYEAYTYFAGLVPAWGMNGGIGPSYAFPGKDYDPSAILGDATQNPATCPGNNCKYKSPIQNVCQTSYIIILSAGRFASDTGNDTGANGISNLPFFVPYKGAGTTEQPGKCSINSSVTYTGQQLSDCPDDLAYSLRTGGFLSGKAGAKVLTYTIGFDLGSAAGSNEAAATNLLKMIATAGAGEFYNAGSDSAQLETVLTAIFNEVVIQNASFTSPTVSVNSFNRTLNLNDLYMAVFRPSASTRWKGNIKKYKLAANGDILGQNDRVAVANGLFLTGVTSYWSTSPDGSDVTSGGAASKMPPPPTDPGQRKVYTTNGGATGTINYDLSSIKSLANATKNSLLGTTCTPTLTPDPNCPTADQLIDWAYGMDVLDQAPTGGNSNRIEARKDMGDPLHTRPAVVIYGGTTSSPDLTDAVVYAVTNDGYLHAFDSVSGQEKWSFVPWDLLGRLISLYRNSPVNPRTSLGLDGVIRVLKIDRNNNGIVEPSNGDKVWLFFGMRRGGQNYYAVDVTSKNSPQLMWKIGASELTNIGQTWSTPQIARMNIPSYTFASGNPDKFVLVFGGGYDAAREDSSTPQAYANVSTTPERGAGVYVVDAQSGTLVWRAGPTSGAGSPNLGISTMKYSIPADIRVVDLTGDGFADLMYAADLGGQVFRFEIDNSGTESRNDFITGGRLASLGGSGAQEARRFFVAPDVAYITHNGARWLNVALGSGNREMPITDKTTQNRFYSLRDRAILNPVDWNSYSVITDVKVDASSQLVDITPQVSVGGTTQASVSDDAAGWQLDLAVASADVGEKVISESRTFENTIFFPSFVPKLRTDDTDGNVCTEAIGYNYLYVISVFDGKASTQFLSATKLPVVAQGLGGQLNQTGIAPEAAFLFPSPDSNNNSGVVRPKPVCLVGAESCGQFSNYEPKRTYWQQKGAD